jgi:ABC-type transporter Mla subunit MlaD
MATRSQRNTFFTGLFITAAILASVVIVIILSGVLDTLGTRAYLVRFDLAANVGGLQPGAEVRLGGRRIGVVTDVAFERDGEGEMARVEGVVVTLRVNNDIALREDARAYLELPLLGAQGVINFPTLGEGDRLADGGAVTGQLAPPSFLAQAGFGDDERSAVRNILDRTSSFADRLDSIGEGAQATVDDTRAIVRDARTSWDERWSARVDRVTENLDTTAARGPELADDLDARLEEVRSLLASAQSSLDDNRASVDETIENVRASSKDVRSFASRLDGELNDRFLELLDTGENELEKAGESVAEVGRFIEEQRPNLRKTLGNFRLASDQLRDTLVEVRRSPWRLLYRPDTRELEYELLYDAARTYAGALSDLRASSEALREVMRGEGGASSVDRARLDDLIERLDDAFEGYESAEGLFIETINQEARRVADD